jgi:AcrR family transcriptional regulator
MAPQRRTQAERSDTTRAKLLAATIQCLGENGYADTSTTDICRIAGVSRGAQLHHYPLKADLMIAALDHLFSMWQARIQERLRDLPPGRDRVTEALAELRGVFSSREMDAWVEMIVASRTHPELHDGVASLSDRIVAHFRDVWVELFPLRVHDQQQVGRLTEIVPSFLVAVFSGMTLRRMSGSDTAGRESDDVVMLLAFLANAFGITSTE